MEAEQRKEMKKYLLTHPNLNSLYKINNGYDYMVEMICKSLHDLETISDTLDQKFTITKKEVHYIIEDIAREEFFSNMSAFDVDLIHE